MKRRFALPSGSLPRPSGAGTLAAVLLAAALASPGAAARASDQRLPPSRQREILRDALQTFDQAVALDRDDPVRARRLFRRSAGAFQALVADGIRNAALEYNLGNTYFRLGELGRALLHYRRAQRLDPGTPGLAENLRFARNRVEPFIVAGGEQRLLRRVLFWHYATSVSSRFRLALAGSVAGWLALAVWLRRRSNPLAALAALAIVLGLASASSLLWQLHDEARRPAAVVIQGEHVLRLGRGEGYDPAMKQPLGPGVELRILQQRGDWVEVRLPNGQGGWLPAEAVGRV